MKIAILVLALLTAVMADSDPFPDGGYAWAYDRDGRVMVWIKNGVTLQCLGTDSEREMMYGTGDCAPSYPQNTDPSE